MSELKGQSRPESVPRYPNVAIICRCRHVITWSASVIWLRTKLGIPCRWIRIPCHHPVFHHHPDELCAIIQATSPIWLPSVRACSGHLHLLSLYFLSRWNDKGVPIAERLTTSGLAVSCRLSPCLYTSWLSEVWVPRHGATPQRAYIYRVIIYKFCKSWPHYRLHSVHQSRKRTNVRDWDQNGPSHEMS